MNNQDNIYVLTFEKFKHSKLHLKHRKERKRQEKLKKRSVEQEKGFGKDDPIHPGETISRIN